MLGWAVTFLVIALIAAVLGFAGIAGAAAGIAQILFYVFLVIFLISLGDGTDARTNARMKYPRGAYRRARRGVVGLASPMHG